MNEGSASCSREADRLRFTSLFRVFFDGFCEVHALDFLHDLREAAWFGGGEEVPVVHQLQHYQRLLVLVRRWKVVDVDQFVCFRVRQVVRKVENQATKLPFLSSVHLYSGNVCKRRKNTTFYATAFTLKLRMRTKSNGEEQPARRTVFIERTHWPMCR